MGTHLSLLLISMEEALGNAAIVPDMFDPEEISAFLPEWGWLIITSKICFRPC